MENKKPIININDRKKVLDMQRKMNVINYTEYKEELAYLEEQYKKDSNKINNEKSKSSNANAPTE